MNIETNTHFDKNRVFVYKNLHKDTYSLRTNGRVFRHSDWVMLSDVKFKVSETLRQKVIAERQKNIHAGPLGAGWSTDVYEIRTRLLVVEKDLQEIYYNPYKTDSFVLKDNHDVRLSGASEVFLTPAGVYAWKPVLKV